MATSSLALARAGLIDPTKPATYPVILGEDIRRSGDPNSPSAGHTFTGIRYNFKPKHLTDNTQRKSTLTHSDNDGEFDVTFSDNSGGRYVYAGTRVSKGSKYVLIFDSKRRRFILHRLDSLFIMNMVDTPTNHDTAGLKKKHPYINETTKRPRPPRGAGGQFLRRPGLTKKSGGTNSSASPMRPMPKPLVRLPAKPPTVLRSSQDIKKKERRVTLNVPSDRDGHDSDRETKAAKDVREQREAIVVKTARDNQENKEAAARDRSGSNSSNGSSSGGGGGGGGGSGSGTITVSPREAAYQKSKASALSSRPKEGSKLSMETKPSPDTKNNKDKGDFKSRSIDVKNGRDKDDSKLRVPEKSDKGARAEQSVSPEKPRLPEKPAARKDDKTRKDTKAAKAVPLRDGKDGRSTPTKEGKSITAKPLAKSSSDSPSSKAKGGARGASLPMPKEPAPAPAPTKKKRRDWEEDEDDDDDDDGDIGLVIEYPGGPPPARNRASLGGVGSGAGDSARDASKPQLHMPTFDEFQRAGNEDEEDGDMDGYWDPREDEKKATRDAEAASKSSASAPAPTPAKSTPAKATSKSAPKSAAIAVDDDDDDGDDLEAELEDELEAELNKELQEEEARKRREAELEAELEAEFMAQDSESEISEEE
ncbi:uncharacterized protein SPSK_06079 [Sporothrix schenckii 1099-18]|uniref:Transcription elongation factor Eaf N-terminal domain-containing protein n=2 Tax=Sporothrix schenckii TaxID=29908 RepID=U7PRD5_SPOS1|nr:uncharacterized protein SPSK_06079 [Sporothrix schenckii 1099-18]ERS98213.1 hypothetical protein HMPREF1624_04996 [Sporothrix schenckii ATCC 58251]KJR89683.1 hypothetical protein SPSK_06079 [Sporothrix schenckii 1099-18]